MSLSDGLCKVGDDVAGIFDADGEAEEIVADAHALALLGRDVAVGGHGGIEKHGVHVAERGSSDDEFEFVHESEDFGLGGVFEFEADHGSETILGELFANHFDIGMFWVGGEIDAGDAGLLGEPLGDAAGVLALALEA